MRAHLHHNAHVRLYRKLAKQQAKENYVYKDPEQPAKTIAEILEELAQRFARISGCRPNLVAHCDIVGFPTIKHRGGDTVIFKG